MSLLEKAAILMLAANRKTFSWTAARNRLRIMNSYTRRSPILNGAYPTLVHIELTNVCNLKCVMCLLPASRRPLACSTSCF